MVVIHPHGRHDSVPAFDERCGTGAGHCPISPGPGHFRPKRSVKRVKSFLRGGTNFMSDAPDSRTDATLLGRLRHDPTDQRAWSEFVDRYGPKIYDWCR